MEIKTVGIVGSGQMGNGIAHVFALAGYDVTLSDISQEALDRGMANIRKNLADRHHGEAGEEVEVALAGGVPEFGAASSVEHHRGRAEDRHERAARHRCVFERVAR